MATLATQVVTTGVFVQNCWLLADRDAGACAVVDPGEGTGAILAAVARAGWRVDAIWLTHGHVDHVAGVAAVKGATGAPVLLHPLDRPLYEQAGAQARWLGAAPIEPPPPPDGTLAAGQVLALGGLRFEVRHVPGHSPGSVALVGHGVCVGGDVLFAGSVGRTDLPGGDLGTLLASLEREVLSLPDDTRVLPGHGPETLVGVERRGNPFLEGLPTTR